MHAFLRIFISEYLMEFGLHNGVCFYHCFWTFWQCFFTTCLALEHFLYVMWTLDKKSSLFFWFFFWQWNAFRLSCMMKARVRERSWTMLFLWCWSTLTHVLCGKRCASIFYFCHFVWVGFFTRAAWQKVITFFTFFNA